MRSVEELNKYVAEWAGCKPYEWRYPGDVHVGGAYPDLTGSFDNCIKWVFPKLADGGTNSYVNIYYDEKLGFAVFADSGEVCYYETGKNLALAFCRTIEKMRDEVK